MTVASKTVRLSTEAEGDVRDITADVQACVAESGIKDGIATVFCPGSTGALTTMEYEPGLRKDLPKALDRLAPIGCGYSHHETWGDDNGRGHVKAAIIGPGLTVPFQAGTLALGRWQQIVFVECDTRGRTRELVVQIVGE